MKTLKAAVLVVLALSNGALAADAAPAAAAAAAPAPAPAAAPAPAPTSTTAAPTATTSATAANAEEKETQGFSVGVDLDHSLGTGTFYSTTYYASLAATLVVSGKYSFKVRDVKLGVSLTGRLSWEYTPPDNGNGRRLVPWDTRLGFSAPALIKNEFTGISVSPSMGFIIPTTMESWQATLVTSISLGATISKSLWKFDFQVMGSGARNFHLNPMNAVRNPNADKGGTVSDIAATDEGVNPASASTILARAGESWSDTAGMNSEWSASIGGAIKFRITDELSVGVSYTYSHAWRYRLGLDAFGNPDEFVPKAYDSNGNRVATTNGRSDRTAGAISVDYSLNDHFGVGLSASTVQTPKAAADGSVSYFRFPFFAVNNGPTNATSLNLTLSAAY